MISSVSHLCTLWPFVSVNKLNLVASPCWILLLTILVHSYVLNVGICDNVHISGNFLRIISSIKKRNKILLHTKKPQKEKTLTISAVLLSDIEEQVYSLLKTQNKAGQLDVWDLISTLFDPFQIQLKTSIKTNIFTIFSRVIFTRCVSTVDDMDLMMR